MSEEAVELVRRTYEDASRVSATPGGVVDMLDPKAVEVLFGYLDPEIEMREDTRFPEAGIFTGREAVERYYGQFTESFDEYTIEPEEFVDADDDRVLMLLRLRTRGKASGARSEARPGWIHTVRNGKVVMLELYLDRNDALAAVGLPAPR